MKNFKRIICLVIALVMLSSSLSAFAVERNYKVPYEYMEKKEYVEPQLNIAEVEDVIATSGIVLPEDEW